MSVVGRVLPVGYCTATGPPARTVLGVDIRVFGNVAVATATGEILENEATQTRAVEMLLLVKDEDEWKIVAQAGDTEQPGRPLPRRLLHGSGPV